MASPPPDARALDLDAETLRRIGYSLVDRFVEHRETLDQKPAAAPSDAAELVAAFAEPMPRRARDIESVLARVFDEILPHTAHTQHPRFFGFVPSPSNPVSVLADFITSGWNVFAGTWYGGACALALERTVIDWMSTLCGLPRTAGGILVSGGSVANLTALAAARVARFGTHDMTGAGHASRASNVKGAGEAVVYSGEQTHSAVTRALRVLGFADDQIRVVPTDDEFRLDPASLESAIEADRDAGRAPFALVANAGTTNTGAVDPLDALADLARQQGLWFHVDGAYGAPARLTERGIELLAGLERADSIALDPHKWLFQPFEIGCVLMRDGRHLEQAFAVHPEYLRDVPRAVVNTADQGIQLTRSFRALKLWLTFQVFGSDAIASAIDRGIDLAETAESMLEATGAWSIVTPASLGIVTFRFTEAELDDDALDRLHTEILEQLRVDGFAATTSTVLRGRTVLRLCPINPRTTEADLEGTIARLTTLARAAAETG